MRASVHTAPDAHFAVDNKSNGVGKALSRENRYRKFTFLAAALVVGSSTQLCWGAANDSVVGLLAATQPATTGQATSAGGAKKPPRENGSRDFREEANGKKTATWLGNHT